jgi:hypothetical protein
MSDTLSGGFMSRGRKASKDAPTTRTKRKRRKSFLLDQETIDGLQEIADALNAKGGRTLDGREITVHFLAVAALDAFVAEVQSGARQVDLVETTVTEVQL